MTPWPACARVYADVSETPLLLQALLAAFVERALVRKQPLLPAGKKNQVELEALGGMQRHEADAVAVVALFGVHDEADVFEETFHRLELVHEAHKLLQVFQP